MSKQYLFHHSTYFSFFNFSFQKIILPTCIRICSTVINAEPCRSGSQCCGSRSVNSGLRIWFRIQIQTLTFYQRFQEIKKFNFLKFFNDIFFSLATKCPGRIRNLFASRIRICKSGLRIRRHGYKKYLQIHNTAVSTVLIFFIGNEISR